MSGAAVRARNDRAMVWWGAMMPHLKKPPKFAEFVGDAPDRARDVRACVAAWDRVDRALSRNRQKGQR